MRLSHNDLQSVLGAVSILSADSEPTTLPARTNDAVKSIVSTDVLSFEGFGTDNDYQGPLWYTPSGSVSGDLLNVMAELVVEQPFYGDVIGRRIKEAVTVSSYLPISKYRKTAIYNEFFRKIDTDRQMVAGLPVSADLMVSVSLCRLGKEFSGRDCRIFDLLTPHLVRAFREAQFVNRLRAESDQVQTAVEAAGIGRVTIDESLQPRVVSAAAEQLLRKYFGLKAAALPDEVQAYVKHYVPKFQGNEFFFPPAPLEISFPSSKMRISLSFHSASKTTTLLMEEALDSPFSGSAKSDLTPREMRVLFWISQGKTNGEIGILLKISIRTVQKHVEHIFEKLGVETRTAAMSRFL